MLSRRRYILGLAGAAGLAALPWRLLPRCSTSPGHVAHRALSLPLAPSGWPFFWARLVAPPTAFPEGFGVRRVFLDAGHGAPGNTGNTSCFCVDEQDFTLDAASALAERLEATGRFEVRLSREEGRLVPYQDRVAEADRWGADAFISLHSDVRGKVETWTPRPGARCPLSPMAPGFAVLWSDEGEASLCDRRLALARALARRMRESGFLPYGGADYAGLYAADAAQAGVFVDRHAPEQRIYVLRRPSMPSILVETHHALDAREAARWTEPATHDAFAAAVAAALIDVLASS